MLTIIIPTHNRHEYIKRSISYYSNFDFNIYIVDSSDERLDCVDLPTNIVYDHKPGALFHDKILLASENIDSELIALCPDDDFLLPDALTSASDYMSHNHNVSLSFGHFIFFNSETPNTFFSRNEPTIDTHYLSVSDKNLQLKHFMSNYYQVLWSLYKKEVLVACFELIKSASYENDNFIEVSIATVALGMGELNFMPTIYGVREITPNDHWGRRHKSISLKDQQDIQKYKSNVSKHFSKEFSDIALNSYLKGPDFFKKLSIRIKRKVRKILGRKNKKIEVQGELKLIHTLVCDFFDFKS